MVSFPLSRHSDLREIERARERDRQTDRQRERERDSKSKKRTSIRSRSFKGAKYVRFEATTHCISPAQVGLIIVLRPAESPCSFPKGLDVLDVKTCSENQQGFGAQLLETDQISSRPGFVHIWVDRPIIVGYFFQETPCLSVECNSPQTPRS